MSNTLLPAKNIQKVENTQLSLCMTTFSVSQLKISFSLNTRCILEFFFTTDRAVQEDFRGGDRSGSRVAAGEIYKIFLEGQSIKDVGYKDSQCRSNAPFLPVLHLATYLGVQVQHAGKLFVLVSWDIAALAKVVMVTELTTVLFFHVLPCQLGLALLACHTSTGTIIKVSVLNAHLCAKAVFLIGNG